MSTQNSDPLAEEHLGLIHRYTLCADLTAPCVFLVHGRAGNVQVMWTFRRTLPEQVHVFSMQAPIVDPIGGFSWWDKSVGADYKGQTKTSLTLLEKFIRSAPAYYGITPSQSAALGFSQGAAMLSLIIQHDPALFSAVGLLSGLVIQHDTASHLQLPAIFIAHGTLDQTVPFDRAEAGVEFLRSRGADVTFHQEEVGHKVGSSGMRALREWLAKHLRSS